MNCVKCGDCRLNGIVSRSVVVSVTFCGEIDSSHTESPRSSLFMQVSKVFGKQESLKNRKYRMRDIRYRLYAHVPLKMT